LLALLAAKGAVITGWKHVKLAFTLSTLGKKIAGCLSAFPLALCSIISDDPACPKRSAMLISSETLAGDSMALPDNADRLYCGKTR
jgi:hypothetical protein